MVFITATESKPQQLSVCVSSPGQHNTHYAINTLSSQAVLKAHLHLFWKATLGTLILPNMLPQAIIILYMCF